MNRLSAAALTLGIVALGSEQSSTQQCSQHTFIGDSPSRGQPGWHDGTQGLAHDRDYWYVTNTNAAKTRSILWRIPVSTNLAANVECGRYGVSCSFLTDLLLHQYNHYGDPDVFEFRDRTYVLVPLESDDAAAPSGVAIFRANETLDFVTFTHLTQQSGGPWVAVDGDGILYSSSFDTQAEINRFYLDWPSFYENERVRPTLVPLDPILLQDETGAAFDLNKAQGGEFSDDGRRFYMSNGDGRNEAEPTEGLHVFTIQLAEGDQCGLGAGQCTVARQVERSHNSDAPGFAFEFHPGANIGATGQEPEGLTYWDLDPNVPGLGGQLHVVLLDNDSTDAEEVYVKHYAFLDVDVEPPVLTCPAPITVECVSPGGVPAANAQLAAFFAGVAATDVCTTYPRINHDAPGVFPLGTTPVAFTATDDSSNASTCLAPVTVVDTTLPTISVRLSRSTLWPPDHELVPITATLTVGDACGSTAVELVSITSSEPDDGSGDGNTINDIQDAEFGTADLTFLLRAERSGSSPEGRVYTVMYRVTDGSGNASVATASVHVPQSN